MRLVLLGTLKLAGSVVLVDRGAVQAAVRYSLMSPAQVVCRWIGWSVPIGVTSAVSLGARWWSPRCGRRLL